MARGAKPLARLSAVLSDRNKRAPGAVAADARAACGRRSRRGSSPAGPPSSRARPEPSPPPRRSAPFSRRMPALPCARPAPIWGTAWSRSFAMNIALATLALGHGKAVSAGDSSGFERHAWTHRAQVVVTSVGHWRGEGMALVEAVRLKENAVWRPHRDQAGRPSWWSPACGVVTSLGTGKADNWQKLTAGHPASAASRAFATDGLRTTHRRHRRLRPGRAVLTRRRCPSGSPRSRRGSHRGGRASARTGDFPGPLFSPWRRSSSNGRSARSIAAASGANDASDLRRSPARRRSGQFDDYPRALPCSPRSPKRWRDEFGTKGSPISLSTACASGATAIQLGVEAIRRGEARGGAVHRHRRLGQSGIADPLFAAVGAVDRQRSAAGGRQAVLRRTATASSWRKAPARWCWRASSTRRRAAPRSSA